MRCLEAHLDWTACVDMPGVKGLGHGEYRSGCGDKQAFKLLAILLLLQPEDQIIIEQDAVCFICSRTESFKCDLITVNTVDDCV